MSAKRRVVRLYMCQRCHLVRLPKEHPDVGHFEGSPFLPVIDDDGTVLLHPCPPDEHRWSRTDWPGKQVSPGGWEPDGVPVFHGRGWRPSAAELRMLRKHRRYWPRVIRELGP